MSGSMLDEAAAWLTVCNVTSRQRRCHHGFPADYGCLRQRVATIRLATTIEAWWPAIAVALAEQVTYARTEGFNRIIKQVRRMSVNRPSGARRAEGPRRNLTSWLTDQTIHIGACARCSVAPKSRTMPP
jgi:Transposase